MASSDARVSCVLAYFGFLSTAAEHFSATSLLRYDAGYYGYIYSECYAADLFSIFETSSSAEENELIDASLGLKYRQEILARGATKRGEEMLMSFLGRAQSTSSFFDRLK